MDYAWMVFVYWVRLMMLVAVVANVIQGSVSGATCSGIALVFWCAVTPVRAT